MPIPDVPAGKDDRTNKRLPFRIDRPSPYRGATVCQLHREFAGLTRPDLEVDPIEGKRAGELLGQPAH